MGRIGGDEFLFILEGVVERRIIERICKNIVETLGRPFDIGGKRAKIGGSIGIALFPDDGSEGDRLIHKADEAMYRVKREGKNRYGFASDRPS